MQHHCSRPGCFTQIERPGLCSECRRVVKRYVSNPFYKTARWKRLRKVKLSIDPLCEMCKVLGAVTAANEVDHIVPLADGGAPYSLANLQSLCKSHHSQKTTLERLKRIPK